MKFSEAFLDSTYRITGYDEKSIWINKEPYHQSLFITAQTLQQPWDSKGFKEWTSEDLSGLLTLKTEVLLIGSGKTYQTLNRDLYKLLVKHNIGFEVMDTAAACRTFNFLLMESRPVAAALFIQ